MIDSTDKIYKSFFENIARYTCTFQNNSLPLHREPALGMSAHQRRRVADINKKRLLALVLALRFTQSRRAINAPWCV